MRQEKKTTLMAVLLLCLAWPLWLAGCAGMSNSAQTRATPAIEWQVTPEAKVTQFDYEVGKFEKDPALTFTVGIQNVSDKATRFRLNIFLLDMDKAAGYLVPVKGKPPVLGPGKAETVKVPFIKTAEESKKILVVIKTASY